MRIDHRCARAAGATATFAPEGAHQPWTREEMLDAWERPLRLLGWAMTVLALALLARHL